MRPKTHNFLLGIFLLVLFLQSTIEIIYIDISTHNDINDHHFVNRLIGTKSKDVYDNSREISEQISFTRIQEDMGDEEAINRISTVKSGIQANNAWGAPSFNYRKNITIDSSKVQVELTDFPMLLVLYDNDLRYHTQADGDDILFLDELNRSLDHEIDFYDLTYNSSHAYLIAWIRIPTLSGSSNTTITMYYGNPTFGNQENTAGVWNNDYVGVWHLNEDFKESSSNGNTGVNYGSLDNTGKIGGSRWFDGIDDYISLGVWDPGIGTGDYSISGWVKLNNTFDSSSSESMPIFGHFNTENDNMVFLFAGQDNSHGNNGMLYSKVENGGFDYINSTTTSWQGNTWIYIAATADQSTNTGLIYKNGLNEGSMSNTDNPTFGTNGNYQIGRIIVTG